MATWTVDQKVEVWYRTSVEADSLEEAIKAADESGGWEIITDTQTWEDEYEATNEDTHERYSVTNGITYAE